MSCRCFKAVVFLVSIQLFFLILPFVCELNLFLTNIGYGEEEQPNFVKLENPRMWHQLTTHAILNCLILLVLMFHILFELFTVFSPHFLYIVISDMLVFSIYLLAFHEPTTGGWWMTTGIAVSGFLKLCYAVVIKLNTNFISYFVHETYTFI